MNFFSLYNLNGITYLIKKDIKLFQLIFVSKSLIGFLRKG